MKIHEEERIDFHRAYEGTEKRKNISHEAHKGTKEEKIN